MNIQTPVKTLYGNWRERYAPSWNAFVEHLKRQPEGVVEELLVPETSSVDIPTGVIARMDAHRVLSELKDQLGFNFLTDYTATDEGGSPRFNLVIHLMSFTTKARVRIKIRVPEGESFPTLIPLWEGANWAEREIFDMFGIPFANHPDLRRILMDVRWEGHPLRKDYPLRGYQVFLSPEPLDPELFK